MFLSVTIPKPTNTKWVKFNYNQVGYYRVNYENSVWDNLISYYTEFTTADKTHLLEETFRLAESGELSYDRPLALTNYLKEEINYIPWSVASTMLNQIKLYLGSSEYLADFKVNYNVYYVRVAKDSLYFFRNMLLVL